MKGSEQLSREILANLAKNVPFRGGDGRKAGFVLKVSAKNEGFRKKNLAKAWPSVSIPDLSRRIVRWEDPVTSPKSVW